ncbi:hypothetical protein ACYZTR_12985 [Pseudomonas sp. Hz4]
MKLLEGCAGRRAVSVFRAYSRAGSLPQLTGLLDRDAINCGSEPARESVGSGADIQSWLM